MCIRNEPKINMKHFFLNNPNFYRVCGTFYLQKVK